MSLVFELHFKAVHRATSKDSDEFKVTDKSYRMLYVMAMVVIEFIVFFTEDATVLVIWWQTGTYDATDTFARANLFISVASAGLCMAAFLWSVADTWRKLCEDDDWKDFLLPCTSSCEAPVITWGIHFLACWMPILLTLGLGFWAYLGIAFIDEGTCCHPVFLLFLENHPSCAHVACTYGRVWAYECVLSLWCSTADAA